MNVERECLGSVETKGVEGLTHFRAAAMKRPAEDTQYSQVHCAREGRSDREGGFGGYRLLNHHVLHGIWRTLKLRVRSFLFSWQSQTDDEVVEIGIAFSDHGPLSLRASRSNEVGSF